MKRTTRESGFAKYLYRSLKKDKQARVLFCAELMREPVTAQLRLLRHFHGLSQMALSRKVRLAQPELARLERMGSNPRIGTIEKIARSLGARLELVPEAILPLLAAQQLRIGRAQQAHRSRT